MDCNWLGVRHGDNNEIDERTKKRKVIVGSYIISSVAIAVWWHERHMVKEPSQDFRLAREFYLRRLYYGTDRVCIEQLRLNKDSFNSLCKKLHEKGGLRETSHVRIEEAVAMFLYILAHNLKNRVVKFQFMRSGETVSRQFNAVLRAVIRLGKELLVQQETEVEGFEDEKWAWFQDCLGALDGTYVPATVPIQDQGTYRNRKNFNATNVLGVCSRDLMFTYVLPGWEGSAADGRVLSSVRCIGKTRSPNCSKWKILSC
uniref:Uncharacterized protein n=1 Tax=Davidia involucrata TaxID=16924 RepID=A0A5B6Z2Q3_DAVIN